MTESPDFRKMSVAELRTLAETLGVENASQKKKNELIEAITNIANPDSNNESSAVSNLSTSAETPKEKRKRKRVVKAVSNENEKNPNNTEEGSNSLDTENLENSVPDRIRKDFNEAPESNNNQVAQSDSQEKPKRRIISKNRRQDNDSNDSDAKSDSEQKIEKEESQEDKKRKELLNTIMEMEGVVTTQGVLETVSDGYGFLRSPDYHYMASPDDVYVPSYMIKQNGLKVGDTIKGSIRPPKDNEKYFCLVTIDSVNGKSVEEVRDRVAFEHLTPLFPEEKLNLCDDPKSYSNRIIDLVSPIGKGQRGLIVAQPKTGKTWILKGIANAIAKNHPEVYMMILLIDERPEEVTDMARSVRAEVVASTFDEPADKHVKLTNIVLEKAKRLVESGHDVVILLDSITRLARAFNTAQPASGKILSGGVDANALHKPKRFFGAARNIENGGSLTIIATALTETGSKMDEVIFEEFKGTGNMELQLDRRLSNKRIYPAIDIMSSSTRREDLLIDKSTLQRMWVLRNYLADMNPEEAMNTFLKYMHNTQDNLEFLVSMNG
ncbi:MAG: transcription termination factor Rho [Bacteroidia bacterium]